ncbi:MAG TPA: glycosyltransferase [Burkholderiaceae bacterium]|nr:glycosyltransferase [Burkholderiaceae bacterium]
MAEYPALVSWHLVLTEHQSETQRALQSLCSTRMPVRILARELAHRTAQGWSKDLPADLDLKEVSGFGWPAMAWRTLRAYRDRCHIFHAPFGSWRSVVILCMARMLSVRIYIVSEPYSESAAGLLFTEGQLSGSMRKLLRPWLYGLYGALFGGVTRGMFAISPLAVRQFGQAGFLRSSIFPFGYFVSGPPMSRADPTVRSPRSDGVVRCAFVGNLLRIKGIAELCRAVSRVNANGVRLELHVYGSGPQAAEVRGPGIELHGRFPFGTAVSVLRQYQLLVLPSLYDGWGVVVNEAVLAGVPVVCSEAVGAAGMIRRWRCGKVFAADGGEGLFRVLHEICEDPRVLGDWAANCGELARIIRPEYAARYMLECVAFAEGNRAEPPACKWY